MAPPTSADAERGRLDQASPDPTSNSSNTVAGKSTDAASLEYKVAGALGREAIERACVMDLGQVEWRVFGAVIHRTISYSKAADRTSSYQLAGIVYGVNRDEVKPWQRRNVTNALTSLSGERRLIAYDKGSRTRRLGVAILSNDESASIDTPSDPDSQGESASRGHESASAGHQSGSTGHTKCVDPSPKVRPPAATPSNGPSNEPEESFSRNENDDESLTVDALYDSIDRIDREAIAPLLASTRIPA